MKEKIVAINQVSVKENMKKLPQVKFIAVKQRLRPVVYFRLNLDASLPSIKEELSSKSFSAKSGNVLE